MFSKNLKYYRLKKGFSKKQLAEKLNITAMAVTNYEEGKRNPSSEIIGKISACLDVKVTDLLAVRNEKIKYVHEEFRKNSKLSIHDQNLIKEGIEEYFDRFMTAAEILGGDVIPVAPKLHSLELSGDNELNALALRKHLGLAKCGPIEDIIGILENKGILVYEFDVNNNSFSGINGLVDDHPYIAFNSNMTAERIRSTVGHELAHLMFRWPDEIKDTDIEKKATAISGAFFFSDVDAKRELGYKRTSVSGDMVMVAKEYGISMFLLVKRANICHIISDSVARDFYIKFSQMGWRSNEPSRINRECPLLFQQLVLRAIGEEEINIQRGAELLKRSYIDVSDLYRISSEA